MEVIDDPASWLHVAACGGTVVAVWIVVRALGVRRLAGCDWCGYDTKGLAAGKVCPECGNIPQLAADRWRPNWRWLAVAAVLSVIGVTQWLWVSPAADWIWLRALPSKVVVEEFDLNGLRWRELGTRGERGTPRAKWNFYPRWWAVRLAGRGWVEAPRRLTGEEGLWIFFDDPSKPTQERSLRSVDVTGDGVPEHFVEVCYGMGSIADVDLFMVDEAKGTVVDTGIGNWPMIHSGPVDVDGDGVFELEFEDFTMFRQSRSELIRPSVKVIISMRNGVATPVISAMRKPGPSDREIEQMAKALDESETFWEPMRDWMYAGNEDAAWRYFDLVWPKDNPEREDHRREFLEGMNGSPWWPTLRAAYEAEERGTH